MDFLTQFQVLVFQFCRDLFYLLLVTVFRNHHSRFYMLSQDVSDMDLFTLFEFLFKFHRVLVFFWLKSSEIANRSRFCRLSQVVSDMDLLTLFQFLNFIEFFLSVFSDRLSGPPFKVVQTFIWCGECCYIFIFNFVEFLYRLVQVFRNHRSRFCKNTLSFKLDIRFTLLINKKLFKEYTNSLIIAMVL